MTTPSTSRRAKEDRHLFDRMEDAERTAFVPVAMDGDTLLAIRSVASSTPNKAQLVTLDFSDQAAPAELGGGKQGDVAVERLATAERKPPASF